MRNRFFIPIMLLVVSLSSNAHALTISGWSVKIKSIEVVVDLEGVPPTTIRPSIADAKATLKDIEYLCENPKNKSVVPGVAGFATLSFSGLVIPSEDDLEGRGTATANFNEEDPFNGVVFPPCKRNWTTIVPGSAAAKTVILDLSAFTCAGRLSNGNTIEDACYIEEDEWILGEKTDAVKVTCTLTDILRDPQGLPVPGQAYTCED